MTIQELIDRLQCCEDKSYEVLIEPDDSTLLGIKRVWTNRRLKSVILEKE